MEPHGQSPWAESKGRSGLQAGTLALPAARLPQPGRPAGDGQGRQGGREEAILWWTAIILGVVEGLTEFLPVSSTGHLIVVGYLLGFKGPTAVTFEIVIQLGAILGVIFYLRNKILVLLRGVLEGGPPRSFLLGIGIAFLPAAVVGLWLHEYIEIYLFTPITVAVALIVGGVAILVVERYHPSFRLSELDQVGPHSAFWVGVAQVLALFPGVSRSGATIMGGLLVGMRRDVATEFSFFLSIPTMLIAKRLSDTRVSMSVTPRSLLRKRRAAQGGLALGTRIDLPRRPQRHLTPGAETVRDCDLNGARWVAVDLHAAGIEREVVPGADGDVAGERDALDCSVQHPAVSALLQAPNLVTGACSVHAVVGAASDR